MKEEGTAMKSMEEMSLKRPCSADYEHELDVEIDLSELGLSELLQRRETWIREFNNKRYTGSPKTG